MSKLAALINRFEYWLEGDRHAFNREQREKQI